MLVNEYLNEYSSKRNKRRTYCDYGIQKKTAQKSKQCYNKILSIRFRHNDAWNSSIASSIVNRTNERTKKKNVFI